MKKILEEYRLIFLSQLNDFFENYGFRDFFDPVTKVTAFFNTFL